MSKIGNAVAEEMEKVLNSEEYANLFYKKANAEPEKESQKESKAETLQNVLYTFSKISKELDDYGCVKTSVALLKTIDNLIKEAQLSLSDVGSGGLGGTEYTATKDIEEALKEAPKREKEPMPPTAPKSFQELVDRRRGKDVTFKGSPVKEQGIAYKAPKAPKQPPKETFVFDAPETPPKDQNPAFDSGYPGYYEAGEHADRRLVDISGRPPRQHKNLPLPEPESVPHEDIRGYLSEDPTDLELYQDFESTDTEDLDSIIDKIKSLLDEGKFEEAEEKMEALNDVWEEDESKDLPRQPPPVRNQKRPESLEGAPEGLGIGELEPENVYSSAHEQIDSWLSKHAHLDKKFDIVNIAGAQDLDGQLIDSYLRDLESFEDED